MSYQRGGHSKYDLKYKIVWSTKYRHPLLQGKVGTRTREIIREICKSHKITIIRGSIKADHVHLLVSVPPSISVSNLIQYLKGGSSFKLLKEFPHIREKTKHHLWARGYFAVTVGDEKKQDIESYLAEFLE